MAENGHQTLIHASRKLAHDAAGLRFSEPVTHVYNTLVYAREPHEAYIGAYGRGRKRTIFLGMNPGPWGMAQTGVPFGEIDHVVSWLGIRGAVGKPSKEHPKRPVTGFACEKSEVSGRRLWSLFAERFGTPGRFFADHYVANYCPLVFMEESGRNRTPDKLPTEERDPLFTLCDDHLRAVLRALRPAWIVGIGRFAESRASDLVRSMTEAAELQADPPAVIGILHPSPANPRANRGWADEATRSLTDAGVWTGE